MSKFSIFFLSALVAVASHAAPASDASIETLLTETNSQSLIDSVYGNVEQSVRQEMQRLASGKTLTEKQRHVLEIAPTEFARIAREEMSWERMKPFFMEIYRESFDQEEVDGMIAFYRSPAGQAVLNKMPLMMQKMMGTIQELVKPMIKKNAEVMRRTLTEAGITP